MVVDDNKNLYAEMTQRFHMMVPMPFKTGEGQDIICPMVVLSGREVFEAKQKAEADTRASYGKDVPKKEEASGWDEKYLDHLAYYQIFFSVRQPNDIKKKFFPNKESVMDALTSDQAGILANNYMTVTINQPWLVNLDNDDPEKMEGLIQKLIQNGTKDPNFFLNSLTSHSANLLINFMAAKLAKSQMDNGSPTSQPNDTEKI